MAYNGKQKRQVREIFPVGKFLQTGPKVSEYTSVQNWEFVFSLILSCFEIKDTKRMASLLEA
jgi:hypothetical protein